MDISATDLKILKNRLTGSNLTNLLISKKLKKYRIAKDCGLTYRTLLNWQKGINSPSDENAITVGRYMGLIEPDEAEVLDIKRKQAELQKRIDRLT